MNTKPPADFLLRDLARCLVEIKADPHHTTATAEGALKISREALHLVIQTLDLIPQFQGSEPGNGLTKPLWDLQLALLSISEGIAHPMLTPPKVGKRVKSAEQQALIGWAAVLFDCFQKSGMTRNAAGTAVADELTTVKLSQGDWRKTPTGKTVEGWINKVREGEGSAPRDSLTIWRKYVEGRAATPGVANDRWTAWALEYLRGLVANRLILLSPPAKVEG